MKNKKYYITRNSSKVFYKKPKVNRIAMITEFSDEKEAWEALFIQNKNSIKGSKDHIRMLEEKLSDSKLGLNYAIEMLLETQKNYIKLLSKGES